jgi:hypothetical protein
VERWREGGDGVGSREGECVVMEDWEWRNGGMVDQRAEKAVDRDVQAPRK